MNVIKSSIQMRFRPDKTSNLETECLFGECLTIIDEYLDWYYCRLLTDNYHGWVKKKYLDHMKSSTHRVISNRTFLFKNKDVKLGFIDYLPLGSEVCIQNIESDWAEVCLFKKNNYDIGYVASKHLIEKEKNIKDWVSIAEGLIGTPYVWGGRNSIGLDCSALLQLSYQTYGEKIPRNSVDQSLLNKEIIKDKNYIKRGFTVFWKDHVGIMADETNCIHANAFHMKVTKEPLSEIVSRTKIDNPIIKIMNFN